MQQNKWPGKTASCTNADSVSCEWQYCWGWPHLEIELGAGLRLKQDLAVYFAQSWLHSTLRDQPASDQTNRKLQGLRDTDTSLFLRWNVPSAASICTKSPWTSKRRSYIGEIWYADQMHVLWGSICRTDREWPLAGKACFHLGWWLGQKADQLRWSHGPLTNCFRSCLRHTQTFRWFMITRVTAPVDNVVGSL